MKIKRTTNGHAEWLASRPLAVLGEDAVTIDHVETAWTEDEATAFDFMSFAPTAQHARDIGALLALAGYDDVELPSEFASLPEPAPRPAPKPAPAIRVERRETAEGRAMREAAERAKVRP